MRSKHRKFEEFAPLLDMERVVDALDLDVIEQKGDELRCHCHDGYGLHKHGDRTGKMTVNLKSKVWSCFVCGGGGLISLVMAVFDYTPEQARDWLYEFAVFGESDDDDFTAEIDNILNRDEEEHKPLPYFNTNFLQKCSTLHQWFDSRHIKNFFVRKYSLGFDPSHIRYSPRRHGEYIDDPYEGPAIILPHFWQNRLVGWQCRWLDPDRPKWVPKYTATPGLPTDRTLWNYDEATKTDGPVYVVESVPSALYLLSEGYNSVATFGATVRPEQTKLLRVFQDGVFLCPDNDRSGESWVYGLLEELDDYVDVACVAPINGEEGADLGDLEPVDLHQHLKKEWTWL